VERIELATNEIDAATPPTHPQEVPRMTSPAANYPTGFTDSQVAQLDSQLAGDVISPTHREYDRVRRVWNHLIDRHPAAVARCMNHTDVSTAITFARESGVEIAIRGGGHSVAGHSMLDHGLVIDLSPMRRVAVDPDIGRVRAAGGCLLADLDRATQVYGLATPAGVMSQTGIGGLALGGGMGWLTRKFGLTCDNLLAAEVVLADGSVVKASAQETPDLFWALRGAGANFGAVTEFEFAAHPLGTTVPVGVAMYRLEDAASAIAHYGRTMRRSADDLKATIFLQRAVAEPGVPQNLVGVPVCMFVSVWTGEAPDARPVNEELWKGAPKLFGSVQTVNFVELQSMHDSVLAAGACNYSKGGYLGDIGDGCIQSLIESAKMLPSADSVIEITYQHGAQDRFGEHATAFPDRHADHSINALTRWHPGADGQPHIDWAREAVGATTPWQTSGLYSNFMSVDDDHRVRDVYSGDKYEKLRAIKAKYDPQNIFAKNPNIPPAPDAAATGGAHARRL
jgi:FAD/FMN-containing dehydrogenase